MRIRTIVMGLALVLIAGLAMAQPSDVPQGHWAYQAVSKLAEEGLVLGYPDGKFLGDKPITRYEMAVIISRVMDNVKQMPVSETKPSENQSIAAGAPQPQTSAPTVSPEDLAAISKLVDEFKTELTVIGADMQGFDERLTAVEGDLGTLKDSISDPESAIQATVSDVKKLKKLKVSGYIQSRYEYDQSTAEVQDGSKNKNGFSVRRARIKVTGNPTDNSTAVIELDASGNGDANSVVTKDAYLEYYLKGNPTLGPIITFGQMKWPFGYQNVQSSSVRETPESARVIRSLLAGEYDRGIKFSTPTEKRLLFEAGVYNGTGANSTDNNNDKDFVGRLRYAVSDHLDFGVSGYSGKTGTTNLNDTTRTRYGADFQLYGPGASLKAEYIKGKDLGFTKSGYWAQVVKSITDNNRAVVMYDYYKDPSNIKNGNLTSWDIGLIHSLDSATSLKLFYEINNEEINEYDNDIFRFEILTKY